MPVPHHLILASGATVVVSMAVATAMAVYENPELRRCADDVRRRIAVAFHSMGDGINPPQREPLFNRPEDAHGFLQSGAEAGVDADDESRRRQREELLYWNMVRMQKEEEEQKKKLEESKGTGPSTSANRTGTFDDFLRPDGDAEKGTYVFNTGAEVKKENDGLRHRGDGTRGMVPSYANPFADENHIADDDLEEATASQIAPGRDEIMSDIYSATTVDHPQEPRTPIAQIDNQALLDIDDTPPSTGSSATVDNRDNLVEVDHYEYTTAGQDDRNEAYASIQAWAQNSAPDFYSVPSEPEVDSDGDGELTPTDSVSLVGSGDDIANDVQSTRDGETGSTFDVMSMSESDGMHTPSSWSEVGSVVSESDAPVPTHA